MNYEKNILISVVIPTYNRANFIKNSINSVLAQTYKNFEIIVVDDGSTDNTKEIIDSIIDKRIRFIKHPKNMGATTSRNTGIKAAQGEWIAFLDSDDIWFETKLEKQVNEIHNLTNDYAVVHCGIIYVDYLSGKVLGKRIATENISLSARHNLGIIPQTSSMLIKKDALLNIGMFDKALPAMQESIVGLKLAQNYKFKLVNEYLVHVTRNHDQIRGKHDLYVKAKEIIVKKYKDMLSDDLLFGYYKIIAGDQIVKKNFKNARSYLLYALKIKPDIKTLITFLMSLISPNILFKFFYKRYKDKNFI